MIITHNWIKQHLKTIVNFDKIIEKLTDIGLEVEGFKSSDNSLDKFIICKILKAEKHPNADKLKVCNVDIGDKKITKVVCGAPNAVEGLFTIYAPPGAVIPKNKMQLKIAKIRDITSYGMLCSESELNLSNESDGIISLNKKDKDIGKKFFDIKKEKIVDISITPNRPDCLGVRGIARDLAAAGLGSLIPLEKKKIKQLKKQPIKIKILKEKKEQGCLAFGSCYISGVQNKESPDWLKNKIISLGQKPISAIVDITNYIMFDLNRPLHAYDADKIDKEIIVRSSKNGESFEALDNKKYNLKENMCVITDHGGILGLGGVIGGTRTGTEMSTKNILLESAYFYPKSIRKTARELNIDTDAKYRFERGIDPNSTELGLEKATELILSICGGTASKFSLAGNIRIKKNKIKLNSEKFYSVIGSKITIPETKKILESLGCKVKILKKNLIIEPPSWRPDILQEIDLIEELIRIKGFENINLIEPEKTRNKETLNFKQKLFHLSQRALASKGYFENITWSFADAKIDKHLSDINKDLEIMNPISSDLNVLRSSIFSNLIMSIKKNLDRSFEEIAFFEIGPVFFGKNPGDQILVLGGLKTGKVNKKTWIENERKIDVFDVKNDVIKTLIELGISEKNLFVHDKTKDFYHPGRSGCVNLKSIKGPILAYFGEINPGIIKKLDLKCDQVFGFEIFIDNISKPNKKNRESKPKYFFSDYQKSERDYAFVFDIDIKAQNIVDVIKKCDPLLIKSVNIFDVYQGDKIEKNKKSIALNVVFEPQEKTLNESEINLISDKIIYNIKNELKGVLRD